MKLLLAASFTKQVRKLGTINIEDIKVLLHKYPNTDNIVEIDKHGDYTVLKCYLFNKKLRGIIFLSKTGIYVPIAISKKESTKGKNITKGNYLQLYGGNMDRVFEDIAKNRYNTESL